MVGPTAQLAALTCHLNARRQGIAAPRFFPDNTTCRFCESVQFLYPKRGWFRRKVRWEVVAGTPDDWLGSIVDGRFSRAVLVHRAVDDPLFSDRLSAGMIGGGGRWLLLIQRGELSDCWESGWEVGNREAADQRIWRVQYARVAERVSVTSDHESVEELTNRLTDTLNEIEAFARGQNLGGFADCFLKAQACLTTDDPLALVYHRDLAPPGILTLPAARLLACCQAGWVFGGMGSWNDLGFDGNDQTVYETLSDRLFSLMNQAICAGVNETAGLLK